MKRLTYIAVPTMFAFALFAFFAFVNQSESDAPVHEDDWWQSEVTPIQQDASNFSDLQFLKEEIGDKRIVALGEQTHDDGATFETRARLIQFLMEEMDFEVILFENGMFEMDLANQTIQTEKNVKELRQVLYAFWSEAKQHKPLFDYLDARLQANQPTYFGGFDCKQSSGIGLKGSVYTDQLESVIQASNPTLLTHDNYKAYKTIWQDFETQRAESKLAMIRIKMEEEEKAQLRDLSKWLQGELQEVDQSYWAQVVRSADESMIVYSDLRILKVLLSKKSFVPINNRRDELMAENLSYLLSEQYADKKIILFGATYHFMRNNDQLSNAKVKGIYLNESRVMGDLVYDEFEEDIYTIGFTAYEGRYGREENVEKGKKVKSPQHTRSLEYQLHQKDHDWAFVSLKNVAQNPFWSDNPSIRLFDYKSDVESNHWAEVLDAVVFINTMEPVLVD
ncbi:MAG: erythromycin esterase family protein [Bacteroidota bacterium]